MQMSTGMVKADINVTPLVDVVLVLLIIFMVVTPMLASHDVDLPFTTVKKAVTPDQGKTIYINIRGELSVDETPVLPEQLQSQLQELAVRAPQTPIFLKADRRLRYEEITRVLDTISRSGFHSVSLVLQPARS